MEKTLLSFLTYCSLFVFAIQQANAQELTFTYDAAGNQTSRKWVCVNCKTSKDLAVAAKMEEAEEDPELLQQASEEDPVPPRPLVAYPNPVSETLFVEWESDYPVKEVYIYSNTGRIADKKAVDRYEPGTTMQFAKLPVGVYVMVVVYEDGHRETRKVIKK